MWDDKAEFVKTRIEEKPFDLVHIFVQMTGLDFRISMSKREALALLQQLQSVEYKPHEWAAHEARNARLRKWIEDNKRRFSIIATTDLAKIIEDFEYLIVKKDAKVKDLELAIQEAKEEREK